jgi:hypothetical protein
MSVDQGMDLRTVGPINVPSATTDGAVVASPNPNRKVRVVGVQLSATAAGTITFNTKPAGAGTAITIPIQVPANTTVVLPAESLGYGDTNNGEALTATTGTVAGGINVRLTYASV